MFMPLEEVMALMFAALSIGVLEKPNFLCFYMAGIRLKIYFVGFRGMSATNHMTKTSILYLEKPELMAFISSHHSCFCAWTN